MAPTGLLVAVSTLFILALSILRDPKGNKPTINLKTSVRAWSHVKSLPTRLNTIRPPTRYRRASGFRPQGRREWVVSAADAPQGSLEVDYVLDKIYQSVFRGVDIAALPTEIEHLTSAQEDTGKYSIGRNRMRLTDGAFVGRDVETFEENPENNFIFSCGYDGETVWVVDESKFPVELSYDEREAMILGYWIFGSLYTLPHLRKDLQHTIVSDSVELAELGAGENDVVLRIQLRSDKYSSLAYSSIVVDTKTWLPKLSSSTYCNMEKSISLEDWKPSYGILMPTKTISTDSEGKKSTGYLNAVSVFPKENTNAGSNEDESVTDGKYPSLHIDPRNSNVYQKPSSEIRDTYWNTTMPNAVEIRTSRSGYILIPAKIDGEDLGYWIIDTGASSNAITTWGAKRLGLSIFGNDSAKVLGGNAEFTYVQASSLEVGPMKWSDPIFLAMSLDSTKNEGVRIVGILGFDFLSRVILEMRLSGSQSSWAGPNLANLYDPQTYDRDEGLGRLRASDKNAPEMGTTGLKFLSKTAHIEATVKGSNGEPSTNLMMLDTGAGNCLHFDKTKAAECGIVEEKGGLFASTSYFMGAGGAQVLSLEAKGLMPSCSTIMTICPQLLMGFLV
ncbi:hypothetical protein AAMO2058_000766500 [Amorphochlora amoebiformis]